MGYIVIDKSWLQSQGQSNEIKKIASKHRIIVTDILMYEISTTSIDSRKYSCFKKLLAVHNALDFLPNSGAIIRQEMNPFTLPKSFEERLYPDNLYPTFLVGLSKLADPTIKSGNIFNDFYHDHFENKDIVFIKKMGAYTSTFFPELRGLKPGENKELIRRIKNEVGCNEQVVRSVYERIYNLPDNPIGIESFPPVRYLSKHSALFRHIQIYLLAAIIYCGKFGDGFINIQSKKFAHDCVDFEYIISATLANGIATKDNMVKEVFSICCPDGVIYD